MVQSLSNRLLIISVCLFVTVLPLLSMGQEISLSEPFNFSVGMSVKTISPADLNGDGFIDLAIGSDDTNSISILINNGHGDFIKLNDITVDYFSDTFDISDLDGDGDMDIAVAPMGRDSLLIYANNGNGYFFFNQSYATGEMPFVCAIGKLNSDNFPDIVVGNIGSNGFSVFMNNGDGTFESCTDCAPNGTAFNMSLVDLNNDTIDDIVFTNSEPGLNVILSQGNNFGSISNYSMPIVTNSSMTYGDLNSDGFADLAVVNPHDYPDSTRRVLVFINAGDGTFLPFSEYETNSYASSLCFFDLDNDNNLDLIATIFYANSIAVLRGIGDGTFEPAQYYPAGLAPSAIAIADIDGIAGDELIIGDRIESCARIFNLTNIAICEAVNGDANSDGHFNGIDIVYAVNYLKGSGPAPQNPCYCPPYGLVHAASDINGSCNFNGLDVTYGVNFLKGFGGPPVSCSYCPG